MRYLLVPGAPPVDVHTNTKGFLAWFTPEHIGGLLALLLVTYVVIKFFKALTSNPWLWAVVVVVVLAALGFIAIKPPHDPGHKPLVPATGPPIPR